MKTIASISKEQGKWRLTVLSDVDLSRYEGKTVSVDIRRPFTPRTTGARSQENKFRGGCRDISEQIGVPFEEVCEAIRRMATEEGFPMTEAIDGKMVPISTANASIEQEALLIRVMHRFADEHNLYLHEVDCYGSYRTVGGRSREEMSRLQVL